MPSKFNPPIFEHGSAEYEASVADLKAACDKMNRRNRYTNSVKNDRPNPFGDEVPGKPSLADQKLIQEDRDWRDALLGRGDQWWFKRIDDCIEFPFYRAKVSLMIWWELCDHEETCKAEWAPRWKAWDFDADLFCDWDLVEYALHCCGYPPAKARAMSHEAEGRKRMKELKTQEQPKGE